MGLITQGAGVVMMCKHCGFMSRVDLLRVVLNQAGFAFVFE